MNDPQDAEYYDTEGGEIPPETYQPPPALPAVRNEQPNRLPIEVKPQGQQTTIAQARIDAVANLTMHAYEHASRLNLSDEEKKAVAAPFPDEAFRSGAAGKDNLIYIEHPHLRGRLNEVFGPGSWTLVSRSRWAEEFLSPKGQPGSRVYVDAMLVIRGCLAGEGIGSMDYYPKNPAVNYGDAVEGAKSQALRLACKDFGIGLQAWDKTWCEGWWARKRAQGQRQQPQQAQQQKPANGSKPGERVVPPIIPEPVHPVVAKWLEDVKNLASQDDFRRFHLALNNEHDNMVRSEVWQHLCRAGHKLGIVFDRDQSLFCQRSVPQPA